MVSLHRINVISLYKIFFQTTGGFAARCYSSANTCLTMLDTGIVADDS